MPGTRRRIYFDLRLRHTILQNSMGDEGTTSGSYHRTDAWYKQRERRLTRDRFTSPTFNSRGGHYYNAPGSGLNRKTTWLLVLLRLFSRWQDFNSCGRWNLLRPLRRSVNQHLRSEWFFRISSSVTDRGLYGIEGDFQSPPSPRFLAAHPSAINNGGSPRPRFIRLQHQ